MARGFINPITIASLSLILVGSLLVGSNLVVGSTVIPGGLDVDIISPANVSADSGDSFDIQLVVTTSSYAGEMWIELMGARATSVSDTDGFVTGYTDTFIELNMGQSQSTTLTLTCRAEQSGVISIEVWAGASRAIIGTIQLNVNTVVNEPPFPEFSFAQVEGREFQFTDHSTDEDGEVVSWVWAFGDGQGSSDQNPTHTFPASEDYDVTLTVTDDDGATASISEWVPVAVYEPPTPPEDMNRTMSLGAGFLMVLTGGILFVFNRQRRRG